MLLIPFSDAKFVQDDDTKTAIGMDDGTDTALCIDNDTNTVICIDDDTITARNMIDDVNTARDIYDPNDTFNNKGWIDYIFDFLFPIGSAEESNGIHHKFNHTEFHPCGAAIFGKK